MQFVGKLTVLFCLQKAEYSQFANKLYFSNVKTVYYKFSIATKARTLWIGLQLLIIHS